MKSCSIKNDVHATQVSIGTHQATTAESSSRALVPAQSQPYYLSSGTLYPKWPIALLINVSRNHIETSCVGWQAQEHVQLPENARRDASDVKPFSKKHGKSQTTTLRFALYRIRRFGVRGSRSAGFFHSVFGAIRISIL
jgi:hypothetical protein